MPVRGESFGPAPDFTRRRNSLLDNNPWSTRLSGLSALGATPLLQQPGPGGIGIQIVDPSGNLVYSAAQVAADPTLLQSINSGGQCPPGLSPTFAPGGESTCAQIVDGQSVFQPQFQYSVAGGCPPTGWCLTGSNPMDPNSYTWEGGGVPNVSNPAAVYAAQPLAAAYNTPDSAATTLSVQDAVSTGQSNIVPSIFANLTNQPQSTVAQNPNISTVLKPPTGAPAITPAAIANGSPQVGNTGVNLGPGANNASTPTPSGSASASDVLSGAESQIESATGLSGSTLLLIAATIAAFLVIKK